MSRILPLLWTGFGALLVAAYHDAQFWSFAAMCVGGLAMWGEVTR